MEGISLEGLVETKVWLIFKSFLKNPNKIFHLKSIAQISKVPVSSTQRIVKKLAKKGFVESIPVGKLNLYKLNDNEKINKIKKVIYGK
ncbi:helix-turn-helix domain-containing protein [Nanoarchaeota archaeon]